MLFGSSVELFVYLTTGIWRSPSTNKQYPTPNKYISERYMPMYGDKCRYCLSLCLSKSPNFVVKDQRNTFSKSIYAIRMEWIYKIRKCFFNTQHFRGIAFTNFAKTIFPCKSNGYGFKNMLSVVWGRRCYRHACMGT